MLAVSVSRHVWFQVVVLVSTVEKKVTCPENVLREEVVAEVSDEFIVIAFAALDFQKTIDP